MTNTRLTLALVGAVGRFAEAVVATLGMREDRWGEIRLLSPEPSATCHHLRGQLVPVEPLTDTSLDRVDIALFNLSTPDSLSWVPVARAAGAVIIDAGRAHRLMEQVPLVVPDLNPQVITQRPLGIVALPGPITWSLIDAAQVLRSAWGLRQLVVTALIAASFKGESGLRQLRTEDLALAQQEVWGTRPGEVRAAIADVDSVSPFPAPLSHNLIPWVGVEATSEPGSTSVEAAVAAEVRKILDMPTLPIHVTCIQVPVATANALSVVATCERRVRLDQARLALVEAPAIVVLEDDHGREVPTPIDAVGSDPRFLGRLRLLSETPHVVSMFIASDTIRRGATSMIQAAELIASELSKGQCDKDGANSAQ